MRVPGAVTVTYGPWLLPGHRVRSGFTAPTASTPAQTAGSTGGLPEAPWLPELATTTTLCSRAYPMADCRTGSQAVTEATLLDSDMLMTLAPRATANLIPAARLAGVPPSCTPCRPPTRTGMTFAAGAMPTTPAAPRPWPAISAAIAVPWPSSLKLSSVSPWVPAPVVSPPATTAPRRSGTRACTPLSSSATVTPRPRVTGQTRVWMSQDENHHSPRSGCRAAGRADAVSRAPPAGPAGRAAPGGWPASAGRPAAGRASKPGSSPPSSSPVRTVPVTTDPVTTDPERLRPGRRRPGLSLRPVDDPGVTRPG